MKLLHFLKSLVSHWINAVSGTILAVVLTFGPSFIAEAYIGWVQFVIALLAVLVACYLAWQEQYDKRLELEQELKRVKDITPKYSLKITDERASTFDDLAQTVKEKLETALKEQQNAPAPHPFLPSYSSIMGHATTADWQDYMEQLHTFEKRLEAINANAQAIINLEVRNIGRISDEAMNITLRFEDAEVIPNFYELEIEIETPREPGHFALGNIGYENKQGVKRETLKATSELLSIEINRMHPDEKVYASYDPIFLKITGDNPRVNYEIRSRHLPTVIKGTLKIKASSLR